MTCNMTERVAAYASGEDDTELEAHLPGCVACREELAASRVMLGALAQLARSEAALPTRDLSAALVPRRRRPWLVALPALIGAALIALWLAWPKARPPEQAVVPPQPPTQPAPSSDDDQEEVATDDADSDEVDVHTDPMAAVDELSDEDLDDALARL